MTIMIRATCTRAGETKLTTFMVTVPMIIPKTRIRTFENNKV